MMPFALGVPIALDPLDPGLGQGRRSRQVLGQDVARQRQLLREYCRQAEWYASLATTDRDFLETAAHYRDLCAEAQASLTRGLRRQARELTPGAVEVVPYQAPSRPSGQRPMVPTLPGGQAMAPTPTSAAAVSVAAETAQMPPPTATRPVRPTISVPMGPAGGGMAFTGT